MVEPFSNDGHDIYLLGLVMNTPTSSAWQNYLDEQWLERTVEPVLAPEIPIIDPHHHLWDRPFSYETPQLLADLESGHDVVGTVYVEAGKHYWPDGPMHLRPAGETAHLANLAESIEHVAGKPRMLAGIVGGADLTADPAELSELLDAHIAAGCGRFSGVRAKIFISFRADTLEMMYAPGWNEQIKSSAFLSGVSQLSRKGLTLDLVCVHRQLTHVAHLAAAVPETSIVLDHLAPVASIDRVATPFDAMMDEWRRGIAALAPFENVFMKLGGLANPMMAHSLPEFRNIHDADRPLSSIALAELYQPFVEHAITTLGASRCMFESNFPIDKRFTSYRVLWNAFKRLAMPYSQDERRELLMGTAARAYNLGDRLGKTGGPRCTATQLV